MSVDIIKESSNIDMAELKKMLSESEYMTIRKEIDNEIKKTEAGDAGEDFVIKRLKKCDIPMCILHDVRIEYNGEMAQIDIIAVTQRMIFVIEVKNRACDVIVDNQRQVLDANTGECIFGVSPIDQNRTHIEALRSIFPEWKERFFAVLVFSNENKKFTNNAKLESYETVVKISELKPSMDKINNANKKKLFKKGGVADWNEVQIRLCAEIIKQRHIEMTSPFVLRIKEKVVKEKAKAAKAKAEKAKLEKEKAEKEKAVVKNTTEQKKYYKCPECSAVVLKGPYGWFCKEKCGMKLNKIIYNHELTDEQIIMLLSGKEVIVDTEYGRKTVYPSSEKCEYNGTVYFRWKREK